jgi:hypothetical protein
LSTITTTRTAMPAAPADDDDDLTAVAEAVGVYRGGK